MTHSEGLSQWHGYVLRVYEHVFLVYCVEESISFDPVKMDALTW